MTRLSGAFGRKKPIRQLVPESALDALPTPIMLLTSAHRVTYANAAAAQTFGIGANTIGGRRLSDFVDTVPSGLATCGTRSDGERFPVTIELTPLGRGEETGVLAVITDMSEAQRTDERLRLFVLAAPTAMVLVEPSGLISLANVSTQLLFGYSYAELIGMPVDRLVPHHARRRHAGLRRDFADNPDRPDMSNTPGLLGVTRGGVEIPLSITLSPVHVDGGDCVLASITDLTSQQRVQAQAAAIEANRLHAHMLGHLSFSVIAVDLDGLVVDANPAAFSLLGSVAEELVGTPFVSIHDPDDLQRLAAEVGQFRGPDSPAGFDLFRHLTCRSPTDDREMSYVCRDGSKVAVSQVFSAMRDESGRLHGYLAVAYDVSRRRAAETHLARMAAYDELTGLPNRATLIARIDSLVTSADFATFTVVMFDIDHFGRVNEGLGHRAGDEILIAVAQRLEDLAPISDLIACLGGDKFAFVVTDEAVCDIGSIASATVQGILQPVTVSAREVKLGASIGAALFPRDANDGASLVKSADAAVAGADTEGRASIRWFSAAAHHEVSRTIRLQAALPHAIENGELAMYYQPIMSLATGEVAGVEALARWTSPEFGSVPPSQFIPIAEEDETILRLGEWSLKTACADVVKLQNRVGRPLFLAVNVSPQQFQGDAWAKVVEHALATSGFEPRRLDLEITENIFIAHPHKVIEAIVAVQSQGVRVVLDDFGTGYSSLSYLTRFPLDKIKIDRSFVERLLAGGADAAVVEAIIGMAHTLGMAVVAEGVELKSQAAFLQRHGCDEAQGFLYSPALPWDELAVLVGSMHLGTSDDPPG